MHKNIKDHISSDENGISDESSFDNWVYVKKNSRSSLERIVFESEKTETLNTLKDFSFPYKLKGKSKHPPMSSMMHLCPEKERSEKIDKIIKRLRRLEITKQKAVEKVSGACDSKSKQESKFISKNDTELFDENLGVDNSYVIKQRGQENINIDYAPQMLDNFDEKEMYSNCIENNLYSEQVVKSNLLDSYSEKYDATEIIDKENFKVLENVFYPCKPKEINYCGTEENKTLMLYQIKKEEVEKILSLTQSVDEQDNFVAEKVENKQGEYSSNHMCEITNSDQRPVKKVFIVFPKKNDFKIELETINEGRDKRTTCMIKNIPNKYTQSMLTDMLDEHHKGQYDFVYLRMDFKNKCNVGYAFVNFIDFKVIPSFFKKINGKGWMKYKSNKIAELTYASIQGIDNLIKKFKKSTVMCEQQEYRPKVYYRDGPFKGMEWDVMNDE